MEKIIDHARTNFAPTVANLIAFRFFSGLRTSEMVAQRWQSTDWNKMQVLIPQGGLRKQAKTNKARLVSLNSRALDALERQKEQPPRGRNSATWPGTSCAKPHPRTHRRSLWNRRMEIRGLTRSGFATLSRCRCSRPWAFVTGCPTICATPMRRCCSWQVPRRPMQPSR